MRNENECQLQKVNWSTKTREAPSQKCFLFRVWEKVCALLAHFARQDTFTMLTYLILVVCGYTEKSWLVVIDTSHRSCGIEEVEFSMSCSGEKTMHWSMELELLVNFDSAQHCCLLVLQAHSVHSKGDNVYISIITYAIVLLMVITQVVLLPPHLYFKLFEFKDCILSGSTVVSQVLSTEQSKTNASVNACWKNKCNGWIKTIYSYQNKTKLKQSTSFSCLTVWMGILSPFISFF